MRRHVNGRMTLQVRIDRNLYRSLRLESVQKNLTLGQLIELKLGWERKQQEGESSHAHHSPA